MDAQFLADFVRMLGGTRKEVLDMGAKLLAENPDQPGLAEAINSFADKVQPPLPQFIPKE